jgi:hypothetical protein
VATICLYADPSDALTLRSDGRDLSVANVPCLNRLGHAKKVFGK